MRQIRNIAIIAHVDHGKTTLVDQILKQTNIFRRNQEVANCFLDSNDLERERGITILAKNISVEYKDVKINVLDTPGHSDFGGQVERVLKLADGVLLLVDAAEGPMPQTRFVLEKALALNLRPVVVINKIDKPDARVNTVIDKVFDLFCELNASEEQLDFPILYASGRDGWAVRDLKDTQRESILPLMDAIIEYIPAPKIDLGPTQAQIATLDYSDFVGRIGIGRVYRGNLDIGKPLVIIDRNGKTSTAQIRELYTFEGLTRKEVDEVPCGDLCAVVVQGGRIDISDTICDAAHPEPMPPIAIDEPTLSMVFRINDSPLFGKEGKFISSRHLRERLFLEAERDVALRVEEGAGDSFKVSGRGVLHLAILIETMRREGYELSVAKPHVIIREIDGVRCEPIEYLSVDVPDEYAGKIIELVGQRKGEMTNMEARGVRQMIEFFIPTRGLIGLRSKALTLSAGEAIVSHRFERYEPFKGEMQRRGTGTLISMGQGRAEAFAIDALQARGTFFVSPGEATYEGMIVGENSKEGDIVVNVQRTKQLTNMRASGSDKNLKIIPARKLSLEQALEYIEDDELLEVTPKNVRMRKYYLSELERRRLGRPKFLDSDDSEA
ncbi:MAG: translational GTPase TypA [Victivallaceae bacterium]|nr:translational GTPase TypA [Victivallaceae bacterium]